MGRQASEDETTDRQKIRKLWGGQKSEIMNIFHRTKIITVSDITKKEQIQELFARHSIEYRIKVKDLMHKNPADTARIGTLGMNQMKMQYSFYVEKADLAVARKLVRSYSFYS